MSLTIDGKRISELKLALLPGFQHPAAPPIRDYAVSIPGRPGAYYFGSEIEPMEFSLPLLVKPQEDRYKLSATIRKMVDAFIDPYGKPKEVKLIYDYEPDKYYLARYSGSMSIDRYFSMGRFELPLIAYDPHAYSVIKSTDKLTWGSKIPFATPIKISHKPSQYDVFGPTNLNVNNMGSLVVRPVIEIFGRAKSLTLRINGALFTFGDLINGIVMIDAENYTVLKNGQNYLPEMKGNVEMIELNPGDNEVEIGGIDLAVQLTLSFRGKYK
ncbi:phage tail protein [Bacillus anthracis]|nr:phage tail protein [Bacillus anthracis]